MDWNKIMHTALLGTDRAALPEETDASELGAAFRLVAQQEPDKEDGFLQLASITMNWKKCGELPVQEQVFFPFAGEEENPYCSEAARQVLDEILAIDNEPLLQLWLSLCAASHQLLPPERLPVLFDLSQKHRRIQPLLIASCGKRGAWLLKLNNAWKVDDKGEDDTTWDTGTLQQRALYLHKVRKQDPAHARKLLQEVWSQENAAARSTLLQQLHGTVSEEDLPWLEGLTTEKSQKVREETFRLLRQEPRSSLVQRYWDIVKGAVQLHKTKGILGIGSKTDFQIQPPDGVDEALFKTGIEKMSSEKEVADADHILYQLISAVPPRFFEAHYGLQREEIISLFKKLKQGGRYLAALGNGAVAFGDAAWLKAIAALRDHEFYVEALGVFDQKEAAQYALAFLEKGQQPDLVVRSVAEYLKEEWSKELTLKIFTYTANQFYTYNRSFYNHHVLQFPAAIIPELEKCAPANPYAREAWSSTSEYIARLINLKVHIQNVFTTPI